MIIPDYTHTSPTDFFMECSLRGEITWPDSTKDIDIETSSMIGKKMETSIKASIFFIRKGSWEQSVCRR